MPANMMRDIIQTNGNKERLRLISQRYRVPNAFCQLLLTDQVMGIFGCTRFKTLHPIDRGLIKYQVEAFHDIIGEKQAGKAENALYNQYFRAISLYMSRQSEQDFPRRSGRLPYTKNSMMKAG